MIHFGAYLLAINDVQGALNQNLCARGEIALIFSKHKSSSGNKPVDLMFERGSVFHGIEQQLIRKHFRHLYTDSDFVICGCSSNDGWAVARQLVQSQGEDI